MSELTRWIFENEGTEFVSGVQHAPVSTGLAGVSYGLLFGVDVLKIDMKIERVELNILITVVSTEAYAIRNNRRNKRYERIKNIDLSI